MISSLQQGSKKKVIKDLVGIGWFHNNLSSIRWNSMWKYGLYRSGIIALRRGIPTFWVKYWNSSRDSFVLAFPAVVNASFEVRRRELIEPSHITYVISYEASWSTASYGKVWLSASKPVLEYASSLSESETKPDDGKV